MKDGLYSFKVKGFDGVDWPPGGVLVLRNGVMLGGGPFTYFTGSYSAKHGIFKGELVVNQHTPAPASTVFFNAKDIGMGVSGTYEGDQAELTGTALIGKRKPHAPGGLAETDRSSRRGIIPAAAGERSRLLRLRGRQRSSERRSVQSGL